MKQREIKFRAWDKEFNAMVTDVSYRSGDSGTVNSHFESERFDYMQFTGLHDKNGKEIYEGDIVEKEGRISYINFDKNQACFEQVYDDKKTSFIYNNNIIIGNIYETPELLVNKE